MSNDRIERAVTVAASRSRVWKAITDADEFGSWFGVRLEGRFAEGARVQGQIAVPGYEHVRMDITIERVEPERLFSYRWHPYAVEPGVDYSAEPTTLVEFKLEEVAGGTRVTVVESGFDRIPLARRAKAFQMNEQGWAAQVENLAKHVAAQR